MSERLGRVRPEGELGAEHRLTLKPGALADEEVVEVTLERLLVDVEDFAAQVQAQRAVRPPKNKRISVRAHF